MNNVNNVYMPGEIYTLRREMEMCYDNKMMMIPAPSEGALEEVVTTNKTGLHSHKQPPLEKLRRRLRIRILLDLFIIVVVGLVVAFVEFGIIPNTKQGFICQDPTISYPFIGDTVSVTMLLLTTYFGPLLIIGLVEWLRETWKKISMGIVWSYYKEYLIGVTLVLLITEVIKVIVGEPRPHFINSCKPDVMNDCEKGTFVMDYECNNTRLSSFFLTDISRSFPSGHTSVSLFFGLYCSYLIQRRIPSHSVSALTKPFLIALCLTWSLFCSLTRITDRRHHWWDVLGGAFLGLCGAAYSLTLLYNKEEKAKLKNRLSRASTTMSTLSEEKNKQVTSEYI